jgi:ferredoxin
MKIVKYLSKVDREKCNGDKLCEKYCPSGAIKVVEKKAIVDEDRCVACGKCEEICEEEAVQLVKRTEPMVIFTDSSDIDQTQIEQLCEKAGVMADISICPCTETTPREIAAAIIKGAKSPEDIVIMTGTGSGCGVYCIAIVFRLFAAADIVIKDDPRWQMMTLSAEDVPESITKEHPVYRFGELF